jgi:hypothetical protein
MIDPSDLPLFTQKVPQDLRPRLSIQQRYKCLKNHAAEIFRLTFIGCCRIVGRDVARIIARYTYHATFKWWED